MSPVRPISEYGESPGRIPATPADRCPTAAPRGLLLRGAPAGHEPSSSLSGSPSRAPARPACHTGLREGRHGTDGGVAAAPLPSSQPRHALPPSPHPRCGSWSGPRGGGAGGGRGRGCWTAATRSSPAAPSAGPSPSSPASSSATWSRWAATAGGAAPAPAPPSPWPCCCSTAGCPPCWSASPSWSSSAPPAGTAGGRPGCTAPSTSSASAPDRWCWRCAATTVGRGPLGPRRLDSWRRLPTVAVAACLPAGTRLLLWWAFAPRGGGHPPWPVPRWSGRAWSASPCSASPR